MAMKFIPVAIPEDYLKPLQNAGGFGYLAFRVDLENDQYLALLTGHEPAGEHGEIIFHGSISIRSANTQELTRLATDSEVSETVAFLDRKVLIEISQRVEISQRGKIIHLWEQK